MPVFRVERNKGYTVMSNYHLRDNSLSIKAAGHFVQIIIVIVIEEIRIEGKGQVLELLCQPVIPLGVLPLKTHGHSSGCVLYGQGQGYHIPVSGQVPLRCRSLFVDVQSLEGEENAK